MRVASGEKVAKAILVGMGVKAAASLKILSASLSLEPDSVATLTIMVPFDTGAMDALVDACKEAGLMVKIVGRQ